MITQIETSSRDEWLEERRKSIGGSDIGAVLGFSEWASPVSVWANKTGRTPDSDQSELMREGHDLEPYIASRFEEVSGLKLQEDGRIWRNSDYPFLHANPDRLVIGRAEGVELKLVTPSRGSAFTDEDFDRRYYAQCVQYLIVTGYNRWYLAVLVIGRGLRVYQITTIPDDKCPAWCDCSVYVNRAEMEGLIAVARDFWQYVETDTQPGVDGEEATTDTLRALYAESDGTEIELFGREDMLFLYTTLKQKKKEIETQMAEIENTIKADMQSAETAHCGDYKITWKSGKRGRIFKIKKEEELQWQ